MAIPKKKKIYNLTASGGGSSNVLQSLVDSATTGASLFSAGEASGLKKQNAFSLVTTQFSDLDFSKKEFTDTTYMFYNCNNMTIAPLISIGQDARYMFFGCTNLNAVNITQSNNFLYPKCDYMFYGCEKLKTVSNIKKIQSATYMFYGCTELETVHELTFYGTPNHMDMFYNCVNLTSAPWLRGSTNLEGAFNNCKKLKQVQFGTSNSSYISTSYVCQGCEELEVATINYLSSSGGLGGNAFYGCVKLKKVIITSSSGPFKLQNVGAFTNTPIGNLADGYVYVPDALVDSYKSATNWSTIATQIKPLSELEE